MFGLAAVAAVAAMAFVGATSAMAEPTQLCTNDVPAACVEPMEVHFTSVNSKGESAKATLLSVVNVECNVLILGTVVLGLSNPVKITVATAGLVYTNCGGCTVTTLKGGTITVLRLGVELADINGSGFEVKVSCAGFINCVYGAENLTGHGLGPLKAAPNGTVSYVKSPVKKISGALCPETSTLDGVFLPLVPIYIRE